MAANVNGEIVMGVLVGLVDEGKEEERNAPAPADDGWVACLRHDLTMDFS